MDVREAFEEKDPPAFLETKQKGLNELFHGASDKAAENAALLELKLYRSTISFALFCKYPRSLSDLDRNDLQEELRDLTLALSDWYRAKGISRPAFCLIQSPDLENWRRASGDQEWLRGQFSIQALDQGEEEGRLLALLGEELPLFPPIEPVSNRTIGARLKNELETERPDTQQFEILQAIQAGLLTGSGLTGFEEWAKKLRQEFNEKRERMQ